MTPSPRKNICGTVNIQKDTHRHLLNMMQWNLILLRELSSSSTILHKTVL